jgi:hypothetical protein
MSTMIVNAEFEVKHYSTKDLAKCYGVCDKTLLKWMKPFTKEIGQKQGRYYTVAQVLVILEKLGKPIMKEYS